MTATPFLISEKFFSEKFFGEILGNIFLGKFWEIFWPNFENIFALLILGKNCRQLVLGGNHPNRRTFKMRAFSDFSNRRRSEGSNCWAREPTTKTS